MIKITSKLIFEIIYSDNLTLQDIEILKQYIALGFHKTSIDNSKLFYRAIKKYNQVCKGGIKW